MKRHEIIEQIVIPAAKNKEYCCEQGSWTSNDDICEKCPVKHQCSRSFGKTIEIDSSKDEAYNAVKLAAAEAWLAKWKAKHKGTLCSVCGASMAAANCSNPECRSNYEATTTCTEGPGASIDLANQPKPENVSIPSVLGVVPVLTDEEIVDGVSCNNGGTTCGKCKMKKYYTFGTNGCAMTLARALQVERGKLAKARDMCKSVDSDSFKGLLATDILEVLDGN